MNIYKINDMGELINGNPYVGRGIVLGKTEDGKNCLVLASVYKNNCSQETTVIVEDDVLEVFEAARRETERQRSRERRHGLKKIYLGNEDYGL